MAPGAGSFRIVAGETPRYRPRPFLGSGGDPVGRAMTFRTTLLAACMIAVPAAALFSHRLPAEVRAAIREAAVAGLARCREAVAVRLAPSSGAVATAVAVAAPGGDDPEVEPRARFESGSAADAPSVGKSSAPATAAEQLAGLGATGFDCHPLAGTSGAHVATCHVPLDAAGQLTRVFQVTGQDGAAAAAALVTEVERWRARVVESAHGGTAAASRTLR